MTDYIKVLGDCFPGYEAYITGDSDPTVYGDLIWLTDPVSQQVLDSSPCALGESLDVGTVDGYSMYSLGNFLNFWHGIIPQRTGTTEFPDPNAAAQVTEGSELFGVDITPTHDRSAFLFNLSIQVDASKSSNVAIAIFRDNQLVGSTIRYCSGSDKPGSMSIQVVDKPNTTSLIHYSVRFGKIDSSGTWYVNRTKNYNMADTLAQHYVIAECSQ